jgi:hypothetical protein
MVALEGVWNRSTPALGRVRGRVAPERLIIEKKVSVHEKTVVPEGKSLQRESPQREFTVYFFVFHTNTRLSTGTELPYFVTEIAQLLRRYEKK